MKKPKTYQDITCNNSQEYKALFAKFSFGVYQNFSVHEKINIRNNMLICAGGETDFMRLKHS